MISETRYILLPPGGGVIDMLDELIDYGFLDEEEAKKAGFFGAKFAPASSVMKVTVYVEEVTK